MKHTVADPEDKYSFQLYACLYRNSEACICFRMNHALKKYAWARLNQKPLRLNAEQLLDFCPIKVFICYKHLRTQLAALEVNQQYD